MGVDRDVGAPIGIPTSALTDATYGRHVARECQRCSVAGGILTRGEFHPSISELGFPVLSFMKIDPVLGSEGQV